jgi:hypothetical protein
MSRSAILGLVCGLILVWTAVLGTGCGQKEPAGPPKKGKPALSDQQAKEAGKTIQKSLKKNPRKGRPSADEGESAEPGKPGDRESAGRRPAKARPSTDTEAPPLAVAQIPEMNYAAMDTSRLAEIMDDIQLTPEPYVYGSADRRDIFEPLVDTDEAAAPDDPDAMPNSNVLRIVGILWAEHDRFALAEAPDGRSRILREGDSLGDGIVSHVYPDRVVVHVTEYGTSRNVTLPLVQGGGFDERSRSRGR